MKFDELMSKLSSDNKMVLNIIYRYGPMTKNQILEYTGLKLTTLNRFMEPLKQYNLVVETGVEESSGGRKPTIYDVIDYKHYIVGVDISRTYTSIVLTNLKHRIIDHYTFDMTTDHTPEITIKEIKEGLSKLTIRHNITMDNIIGIGVGTIGPLNREQGIILNPKNFISKGWTKTPIVDLFKESFNLPIAIDNGANTAALIENLFGAGKGMKNIAYINCGIGIRTGVISDNHIVRSINDANEAFGHLVVNFDGEQCSCGKFGCLECYCSINSICNKYISKLKLSHQPNSFSGNIDDINYVDILQAAQEDDLIAKQVVTESATIFGIGLSNYMNLMDISLVILSGPIIHHSKLFYNVCTKVAEERCFATDSPHIIFHEGGHYKNHSIAVGAGALVFLQYLNNKSL